MPLLLNFASGNRSLAVQNGVVLVFARIFFANGLATLSEGIA